VTTATRPPSAPVRSSGLRPEDVLSAIALGAAAVVAWPLALYFQLPGPAPVAPLVAHVTGMLAGYGVVVLIGLMSRAPALERGVGADRLARWHSRGGRAVVLLVLVHAAAAVQVWAQGESVWLAPWQVLRLRA
jgi:hypothetical protein